jgi:hypothetical protein
MIGSPSTVGDLLGKLKALELVARRRPVGQMNMDHPVDLLPILVKDENIGKVAIIRVLRDLLDLVPTTLAEGRLR